MNAIKAWAQVVVAVVTGIYAAFTDDRITDQEWVVIGGTAVGALGVYIVPNLAHGIGKYAKGVVSFLTAGLAVLYVVIPGGLTQAETLEVLLAGAAAIGLVVGLGNANYVFASKTRVPEQI
jgi:hypothetical protein